MMQAVLNRRSMMAFCFASVAGFATARQPLRIVGFGDSLMAGYGLPAEDAFPNQLQKALQDKGFAITIENAGVSGDTSTGGLDRLDWAIADGTNGVILELGANDALRGIPPGITEQNLDAILSQLKVRNIPVLIAGMRAPPNNGPEYQAEFDPIFARLAEKHGAALYPFFLEGVAAEPSLNQADGIHPNKAGVSVIVTRMLPLVETWLTGLQQAQ
jgi:acyl-CoA thioesterase I